MVRAGACLAALLLFLAPGAALAGCGPDPDPCVIEGGSYHAVLPDDMSTPPASVMLVHGWAASGADMMKMSKLVQTITGRGYALITPDGVKRTDGPGREWWFMPGDPGPRDDQAFLKAVADDAARRFGLDRDRMLLSGFSIGGSMTTYLACEDPGAFAAYAPISGSFWRPQPGGCKGPMRLFHIHGWADRTVPLEGRQLGPDFAQGDVFAALDILRGAMGCDRFLPDRTGRKGGQLWRHWTSCAPGGELLFALHEGNHGIPEGWADLALDWFEGNAP